jgi:hypothetical protein
MGAGSDSPFSDMPCGSIAFKCSRTATRQAADRRVIIIAIRAVML